MNTGDHLRTPILSRCSKGRRKSRARDVTITRFSHSRARKFPISPSLPHPRSHIHFLITLVTVLWYGKTGHKNVQLVLQHCCKTRWIARFTNHVQTCLGTIQVVAGSENLLQKVESSSHFSNKICTCYAFYRSKAILLCSKWRCNSCVLRDTCVILFNQKSAFTQLTTTWTICTLLLPV